MVNTPCEESKCLFGRQLLLSVKNTLGHSVLYTGRMVTMRHDAKRIMIGRVDLRPKCKLVDCEMAKKGEWDLERELTIRRSRNRS